MLSVSSPPTLSQPSPPRPAPVYPSIKGCCGGHSFGAMTGSVTASVLTPSCLVSSSCNCGSPRQQQQQKANTTPSRGSGGAGWDNVRSRANSTPPLTCVSRTTQQQTSPKTATVAPQQQQQLCTLTLSSLNNSCSSSGTTPATTARRIVSATNLVPSRTTSPAPPLPSARSLFAQIHSAISSSSTCSSPAPSTESPVLPSSAALLLDRVAKQWVTDKEMYELKIETLTHQLVAKESRAEDKMDSAQAKYSLLEDANKQLVQRLEQSNIAHAALQEEMMQLKRDLEDEKEDNLELKKANAKLNWSLREKQNCVKDISALSGGGFDDSNNPNPSIGNSSSSSSKTMMRLSSQSLASASSLSSTSDNNMMAAGKPAATTVSIVVESAEQAVIEQQLIEACKRANERDQVCREMENKAAEQEAVSERLKTELEEMKNKCEGLNKRLEHKTEQLRRAMLAQQNKYTFNKDEVDPPMTNISSNNNKNGNSSSNNEGNVVIVFTDVEGSTELWERDAESMRAAIVKHFGVLRDKLRVFGGYEVKSEGDSLMCAFQTAEQAVWWSSTIQESLMMIEWPVLPLSKSCCEERDKLSGSLLFRGLRVRVGVHCGGGVFACQDPVTGRVDYFGKVVNKAARLMACAHGGQVLISDDVWKLINGSFFESSRMVCVPLGEIKFKGIDEPSKIWQVTPLSLIDRSFPPPRSFVVDSNNGSGNNNNNTELIDEENDKQLIQNSVAFLNELINEWTLASTTSTTTTTTTDDEATVGGVVVMPKMMKAEGRIEECEMMSELIKRLWSSHLSLAHAHTDTVNELAALRHMISDDGARGGDDDDATRIKRLQSKIVALESDLQAAKKAATQFQNERNSLLKVMGKGAVDPQQQQAPPPSSDSADQKQNLPKVSSAPAARAQGRPASRQQSHVPIPVVARLSQNKKPSMQMPTVCLPPTHDPPPQSFLQQHSSQPPSAVMATTVIDPFALDEVTHDSSKKKKSGHSVDKAPSPPSSSTAASIRARSLTLPANKEQGHLPHLSV